MNRLSSISVHPEIQDGAPVFSGTRIRIETFYDFLRIGVSVNEFLDEFPSITRDQALEVYDLVSQHYTPDDIAALAGNAGPASNLAPGRLAAA
ncbi:MAG: DUF433 domain-containing protein [Bacteroidetes bacterium]|nr:DUF433 domain-containing protein [Bacteroidota bacterium]